MTTHSDCVTVSLGPSMHSQFRDWPGSIVGDGRGITYRVARFFLISFGGERRPIQIIASRNPTRSDCEEEAVPSIGSTHFQTRLGISSPEGGTSHQEKVKRRS